jgi:hypothetical protein
LAFGERFGWRCCVADDLNQNFTQLGMLMETWEAFFLHQLDDLLAGITTPKNSALSKWRKRNNQRRVAMTTTNLDTFPVARSLHRILWRWRIGAVSTAHTKFGANEQFATGVASFKVLSGRP